MLFRSEKVGRKKERVERLISLSNELEYEYFHRFSGKDVEVLVEECDNNISIGHTSNYLKVTLNEKLEIGNIYRRKL